MAEATGPNMAHVEVLATMEGGWMLRGCQAYYDELKACKSWRGRWVQGRCRAKLNLVNNPISQSLSAKGIRSQPFKGRLEEGRC
jgi:hypothetical protein